MEVPEKIYLSPDVEKDDKEPGRDWYTMPMTYDDVEYTRTDAFIEKACEYIKEHLFDYWSQSVTNESKFIEDFEEYLKK